MSDTTHRPPIEVPHGERSANPALDAELIILADQAYRSLGLRDFRILLNSLGDKECRPVYRAALQDFLRGLTLDETAREMGIPAGTVRSRLARLLAQLRRSLGGTR